MRLVTYLLLFPILCFAQTGPGGVGSTDATSDLVIWLKADNGTNISDNNNVLNVDSWSDHSGFQVIGSSPTLVNRPSLQLNAINEIYPYISFDGKNDFFQLFAEENEEEDEQLSNPFSVKNNFTLLFVARADVTHEIDSMSNNEDGSFNGLHNQKYVLAPSYRTSNNAGFGVSLGTNGISAYEFGTNHFPAVNIFNNNPPDYIIGNAFHIFMIEVVDKISTIYMDGAIIAEGMESEINQLYVPQEIGGGATSALATSDNFFEGAVAEVILYANHINDTEKIVIHNYLSSKYDIPLLKNDVYSMDDVENGNFDHDVAGIGLANLSDGIFTSQGSGKVGISNPTDLDEGEYLFWGKNNVSAATLSTQVPVGAASMLAATWAVSEVGNVGAKDISLSYGGFEGVNPKHLRMVIDTDGDGSFLDETIPTTLLTDETSISVETSEITFRAQNISSGANFTFASLSLLNPLPISLTSFRANVVDQKIVDLNWMTESETNNQYFLLERSTDSRTFETISQIAGNGTTKNTNDYHFLDAQPFRGDNYYRLKQVDFDGTFNYSDIIKVTIEVNNEEIDIYPNPTINTLTIKLPNAAIGELLIQVYDASGQVAYTTTPNQTTLSNITITPNLESGIYFLRVRARNYIHSKSFVVLSEK